MGDTNFSELKQVWVAVAYIPKDPKEPAQFFFEPVAVLDYDARTDLLLLESKMFLHATYRSLQMLGKHHLGRTCEMDGSCKLYYARTQSGASSWLRLQYAKRVSELEQKFAQIKAVQIADTYEK